jgi:hypothetical protein
LVLNPTIVSEKKTPSIITSDYINELEIASVLVMAIVEGEALAGGGDGGCALRRAVDGGGRNDVGPL